MQHACTAGLFALVLVQFTSSIIGEPLGLYVKHHEPLSYSTAPVHAAHQRCRRSAAAADRQVAVEFHALGRHFRLRLRRDVATSVFSPDAVLVAPSGLYEPLRADHMYEGHLEGVPHSFVHGSLHDGVFQGNIETPEGNYYIEKSQYYYPAHNRSQYHSVIYSDEHLHTPQHVHSNGKGPFGGCGVDDETEAWMSVVQNSADEDEASTARDKLSAPVYSAVQQHRAQKQAVSGDKHYKYTEEAQHQLFEVLRRPSGQRHRRSPRLGGATSHLRDGRGTCSISVETDPLLWAQIYEHERDARRTREELTALVASHIKAVNRIYEREQFDGLYPHRGIQFEIQRLKIDNDSSCDPLYPGKRNKFCIRHIDVSNFLNLHSEDDHDAFCLSYVFTYRDFNRGTLGLAWVASAEGSSGGICESYKSYSTTVHKVPITKKRSLNTGIITLVNYSKRVASRVSQLTLAHEIGHNMGSPHDYPSSCTPGSPSGNFIMYSSATSGDLPNNSKFSECSRRNISAVLDAITVAGSKRDCFTKSDGAFCGNKIVEDGEECDCGFDMSECEERCCYPSQVSFQDRNQNASAVGCRRRINTQCSPSEGPCCDRSQCRFVGAFENRQCREADECTYSSQCDGRLATCPSSPPRNNMTECNKGTKVCLEGVCKGSICLQHGLQECFLTSDAIEDSGKLCEVACQQGTDPSTCRSSSELGMRQGDGIYMTAGAACDNFQGYCDVFLKCRRVDAEGPLASLKNLLFSKQTLMTIVEWVTMYWWGVLLMSILFVIVMALFIRCFAVHTPSSNPKRAPARRFADTLKHPMGTLRRQRRPPSGSRPVPSSSSAASRQPSATELQLATPQGPPPPYSSHQQHRTPQQLQQPITPAAAGSAAAAAPTRHGYGQGRGHYSRQAASRSETALASSANSDRKTPSKQPRGKRGGTADPPSQPSRGRRA